MSLDDYRRRRNFRRTSEPRGGRGRRGGQPRFVVQKHDASRLHYDFRLEVDGVLRSWAIPKGPSTDPGEKRLAMPTEDHPLEYGDFEGVIPEGEYGAGPVVLWDAGTYRTLASHDGAEKTIGEALDDGHATVWLDGQKLHGGFALTRLPRRGRDAWLLVKMADEEADRRHDVTAERPESVRSGRTVEQVAAGSAQKRSGTRTRRRAR